MLNNMMDEFMTTYLMKGVVFSGRNVHNMYNLALDEMAELQAEVGSFVEDAAAANQDAIVKESLDVVYVLTQRLRRMGVDVDAALAEVHRSNMSKALPLDGSVKLSNELEIARRRYPYAGIKEGQRKAVLMCGETNKVIKPTTYSEAVITPQMIGI